MGVSELVMKEVVERTRTSDNVEGELQPVLDSDSDQINIPSVVHESREAFAFTHIEAPSHSLEVGIIKCLLGIAT